MRKFLMALTAAAFTAGIGAVTLDTAEAKGHIKKTTLGCIKGKQKWNATAGRCDAVAKKPVKKAKAKKPAKKAVAKKK
jgi:hypothetical protein